MSWWSLGQHGGYDNVLAKHASDFIHESETIDDEIPFFLEITPTVPHADSSANLCNITGFSYWHIVVGPVRYQGTASNVQIDRSPSYNETDVSDKFDLVDVRGISNVWDDQLGQQFPASGRSRSED